MDTIQTTTTTATVEPITFEDLLYTMEKFQYEHIGIPKEIKVAPDVMDFLNDYFIDKEKEARARRYLAPDESPEPWVVAAVFGVNVVIDEGMKPGSWKLVK